MTYLKLVDITIHDIPLTERKTSMSVKAGHYRINTLIVLVDMEFDGGCC